MTIFGIPLSATINEVLHSIPALGALMITNILLGTVNSVAVLESGFDMKRMAEGIAKVIVSMIAIIVLAYAFDIVDLSTLGFTPMTIVTTGIAVYAAKVGITLAKVLGLSKYLSISEPISTKEIVESVVANSATTVANNTTVEDTTTEEVKEDNTSIEDEEVVG